MFDALPIWMRVTLCAVLIVASMAAIEYAYEGTLDWGSERFLRSLGQSLFLLGMFAFSWYLHHRHGRK